MWILYWIALGLVCAFAFALVVPDSFGYFNNPSPGSFRAFALAQKFPFPLLLAAQSWFIFFLRSSGFSDPVAAALFLGGLLVFTAEVFGLDRSSPMGILVTVVALALIFATYLLPLRGIVARGSLPGDRCQGCPPVLAGNFYAGFPVQGMKVPRGFVPYRPVLGFTASGGCRSPFNRFRF